MNTILIKNKYLKSLTHKYFKVSIIRRYIIFNPYIDQIDEIMKKCFEIYNEKI